MKIRLQHGTPANAAQFHVAEITHVHACQFLRQTGNLCDIGEGTGECGFVARNDQQIRIVGGIDDVVLEVFPQRLHHRCQQR